MQVGHNAENILALKKFVNKYNSAGSMRWNTTGHIWIALRWIIQHCLIWRLCLCHDNSRLFPGLDLLM